MHFKVLLKCFCFAVIKTFHGKVFFAGENDIILRKYYDQRQRFQICCRTANLFEETYCSLSLPQTNFIKFEKSYCSNVIKRLMQRRKYIKFAVHVFFFIEMG